MKKIRLEHIGIAIAGILGVVLAGFVFCWFFGRFFEYKSLIDEILSRIVIVFCCCGALFIFGGFLIIIIDIFKEIFKKDDEVH